MKKTNKKIKSIEETKKKLILKKPENTPAKKEVRKSGPIIESYIIKSDNSADIKVDIKNEGTKITYNLEIPEINPATTALLGEIREELITATTVGMREIVDPNAIDMIRKRFMEETEAILEKKIPTIAEETKKILVNKLMQDMLGLGEIEFLVNDSNLEEIVIPSSKEPIRVFHKKHGWLPTNFTVRREDEIINYSNIIARRVGRQITVLSPLLDAHLTSGDRVNAVLYPISTKGNTITIRRFARDPYTIVDLIENKTCNLEIAALLWLAVEYEMNVIISGGTASGKTVILNACMPFIPPNHRIISVEDTRELMLPEFLYWTPLVTRSANPEGKGGIGMLDLLVNSL
ncbi:MAG: ATPase, T2SS/T4P/T4SS family, partial [Candidatus Peregrinibacteria bacterium]|nr:ATPase, T2SS/T4P/T4SS family [Candidatus Peregrinibacteria bacterium]